MKTPTKGSFNEVCMAFTRLIRANPGPAAKAGWPAPDDFDAVADWVDGHNASRLVALGYTRQTMLRTPLVLDRRSPEREAELAAPYLRSSRPLLLVNLKSPSSPFTFLPEVVERLLKLASRFTFVDLSAIRCHRVYDLCGLMERSAGLVTVDTSSAHLVSATKLPYAMFRADGWRGSTPRGNCVWSCRYAEAMDRLEELIYVITSWAGGPPVAATPPTHVEQPA
jgi:hypothetical protein